MKRKLYENSEVFELKGKPAVNVLDRGYVRLIDSMGTDLTVANSARVSYDKQADDMSPRDEKLIKFLADEDHTSPFRHGVMQFEVYTPLMVARQWWKYVIGSDHSDVETQTEKSFRDPLSAWNESSRRYITEEPKFYIPGYKDWRSKPENSKQGSGDCLSESQGKPFTLALMNYVEEGEKLYEHALQQGIAPEQARLFLPAYGVYVRYYWTASVQGVAHFLNQRLEKDAQKEIQVFAQAVETLAKTKFPVALEYLAKGKK
jgi:thymidylate synthase (FAD)